MSDPGAFSRLDPTTVDAAATRRGFERRGARVWRRRTGDFVQIVNLQRSQWSKDRTYLNFALWPLAMGEPPTLAESRFPFRTRAEAISAGSLSDLFDEADRLTTLQALAEALAEKRISGMVRKDLSALLARSGA